MLRDCNGTFSRGCLENTDLEKADLENADRENVVCFLTKKLHPVYLMETRKFKRAQNYHRDRFKFRLNC